MWCGPSRTCAQLLTRMVADAEEIITRRLPGLMVSTGPGGAYGRGSALRSKL